MNQDIRLNIRIPKLLRDWLKEEAREHNRSMNGQLVEILKKEERQGRAQQ